MTKDQGMGVVVGGAPFNGLDKEALSIMGTFFRHQLYKGVKISLAGVYERVGKSVILIGQRT